MRALITFAFVLFLVVSAPLLGVGGVAFRFSPLSGVFVVFLWWLVMLPFTGALCVVWLKDERPRFLPSDIFYPAQKRNYKSWNSINGWPRASNLCYECGQCHQSFPSQTDFPNQCSCGNLFITPDHIGAQTPSKVLLYEE
ncbi:hypothetical protein EON83_29060 [bacterium]|nr:MAG: hypothetical protein EON83_29060 [bacterium]